MSQHLLEGLVLMDPSSPPRWKTLWYDLALSFHPFYLHICWIGMLLHSFLGFVSILFSGAYAGHVGFVAAAAAASAPSDVASVGVGSVPVVPTVVPHPDSLFHVEFVGVLGSPLFAVVAAAAVGEHRISSHVGVSVSCESFLAHAPAPGGKPRFGVVVASGVFLCLAAAAAAAAAAVGTAAAVAAAVRGQVGHSFSQLLCLVV